MAPAYPKKPEASDEDRLHLHLDPKIKARIARAAAITGEGLTDFAVSTLSEKADQGIARHDTILLVSDEYNFFLKALDDDRKPSKRSRGPAKRYRNATSPESDTKSSPVTGPGQACNLHFVKD